MRVATSCKHSEVRILDRQHRDVERAAAKVIDEHFKLLLCAILKTIGHGSCRWLIDDVLDVEASYFASVHRRLLLLEIEVCWNSHDSVGYLASGATVSLGD